MGSKIIPLNSDKASVERVVSPSVINVDPRWGLNDDPVANVGSKGSKNAPRRSDKFKIGDAHISMPPVKSVSNLSLDDRF